MSAQLPGVRSARWEGSVLRVGIEGGVVRLSHVEGEDGLEFLVTFNGKSFDNPDPESSLRETWAPIGLPYETMLALREKSFQRHLNPPDYRDPDADDAGASGERSYVPSFGRRSR